MKKKVEQKAAELASEATLLIQSSRNKDTKKNSGTKRRKVKRTVK